MYRTITALMVIFLSGCATNRALGPIPKEAAEFKLPMASLQSIYPELDVYDLNKIGFMGFCTPISQITTQWGEPDRIETIWNQVPLIAIPFGLVGGGIPGGVMAAGIAYGMYPKQPQHYIWHKGNYEIDVRVITEIGCGYVPRIHYWRWEETRLN